MIEFLFQRHIHSDVGKKMTKEIKWIAWDDEWRNGLAYVSSFENHFSARRKKETNVFMYAVAQLLLRPTSKLLSWSEWRERVRKKRCPFDYLLSVDSMEDSFSSSQIFQSNRKKSSFELLSATSKIHSNELQLLSKKYIYTILMIKHTTFNFSIKMFIWFFVHILLVRCTRPLLYCLVSILSILVLYGLFFLPSFSLFSFFLLVLFPTRMKRVFFTVVYWHSTITCGFVLWPIYCC